MRSICLTVILCALAAAGEKKSHPLPKERGAEVIRFEYEGGFRAPRKDGAPRLAVLADGTLRVARPQGVLQAKVSAEELQDLLRFMIDRHRILEFDGKAVRKEVRKQTGKNEPIVLDAADTVITVTLPKQKVRASFHALQYCAKRYPKVKALQDLRAIEKRLETLVQIVVAGGPAEVEALLRPANVALKNREQKIPPLTQYDLARANPWKNGGKDLLFERRVGRRLLRVTVHAAPSKEPQVAIELSPAR